eukprot:TRINITY_DN42956_c0_g1_i1.p1 TRINITY_DN42956_c0_g1~~TRINITY_DN42956_c0_g1_i1.p1  ORF type:complete len:903 (-),score=236.66 TRINITY_DN42956_c0_g1_i1:78-2786(-)
MGNLWAVQEEVQEQVEEPALIPASACSMSKVAPGVKSPIKRRPYLSKASSDPNKKAPDAPDWSPNWDFQHQKNLWNARLPTKLSKSGIEVLRELKALQARYPYFILPLHYMHRQASLVVEALIAKKADDAKQCLRRLEEFVQVEEDTVSAFYEHVLTAYSMSSVESKQGLRFHEVSVLLQTFGFPGTKDDGNVFMDAVGATKTNFLVNLDGLKIFVGRMGGTFQLSKLHMSGEQREALKRDALLDEGESIKDLLALRDVILEQTGMEEVHYRRWRWTAPVAELRAAIGLKVCQQKALKTVRGLAKSLHKKALGKLRWRFEKLGYTHIDMEVTLAWIRDCAPILIQVDLNTMLVHFKGGDTHYRNQFETNTSGGLHNFEGRFKWESALFAGAYDGDEVQAFDRPKYGVLNVMNDYRGVCRTEMYGHSYLILKDVRHRCTFSPRDSGGLKVEELAVHDYFAHQLIDYTEDELKEVIRVALSRDVGKSNSIGHLKYKEAQIHGEVDFKRHIDRLVAADLHNTSHYPLFIKEACRMHGWKFSWLSEEEARLKKDGPQKLHSNEWRERLDVQRVKTEAPPPPRRRLSRNSQEEGAGGERPASKQSTSGRSSRIVNWEKNSEKTSEKASENGGRETASRNADLDSESSTLQRRPSVTSILSKTSDQKSKGSATARSSISNKSGGSSPMRRTSVDSVGSVRSDTPAGRARGALEEAKGNRDKALKMLQDAGDTEAAALMEKWWKDWMARAQELKRVSAGLTAVAGEFEKSAWARLRQAFSQQLQHWNKQISNGTSISYGKLQLEMENALSLSQTDPIAAVDPLERAMEIYYGSSLEMVSAVTLAVDAALGAQAVTESRLELAQRLTAIADLQEKLTPTSKIELQNLLKLTDLENGPHKELHTKISKLLF